MQGRARTQTNCGDTSNRIGSRQWRHGHRLPASFANTCTAAGNRSLGGASSESHQQGQKLLFADKFIEQRYLTNATEIFPGATATADQDRRSVKQPPSTKSLGSQTKMRVEMSQFRQQSLPFHITASSQLKMHSHQSIPSKSSPRLPLLEKRHSIHPTPLMLRQKSDQQLQNTGCIKMKMDSATSQSLTSALNHIHTAEAGPKSRSQGYRKRHHSLSSHWTASEDRCKTSSTNSSHRKHRSANARCKTSFSNSSHREHRSANGLSHCSSSSSSGHESDGTSLDASFLGDSISLEDADDSEFASLLDDIMEEDDFCGSGGEMERGGTLFEEELTDFEDNGDELLCDDTLMEGGGTQGPLTCIQKSAAKSVLLDREHTSSGTDGCWRFKMLDSLNSTTTHMRNCFAEEIDQRMHSSEVSDSCSHDLLRANENSHRMDDPLLPAVVVSASDTAVGRTSAAIPPLELGSLSQNNVSSTAHTSSAASIAPSLLLAQDKTPPVITIGQSAEVVDPEHGGTQLASDQPSPPLTPSLFTGLPPTIHFPLPHENYSSLPKSKRALLKWRMSTITPNVVRMCIARVGFSECTSGNAWMGYWGKHMKSEAFKGIREYQKVNHFPGTFQIGRKDRLWRNLSKMQTRVGKKECDFVPQTFVLPQDMRQLKREWEEGNPRKKWILKPLVCCSSAVVGLVAYDAKVDSKNLDMLLEYPLQVVEERRLTWQSYRQRKLVPAAARGVGIRVVHRWDQIPKKKPVIVQRYIADPFLINGSKFDLRVYVYVSCYDPLRIYIFKEGLTRFATCRYSSSKRSLSNRFMHLTNYSVNKRNADFVPNSDETQCHGHKWGLLALWQYMRSEMGINTAETWESIQELIVKTIISSEPYVASLVKIYVRNSHSCHELFGFDIMLDKRLKPWILEVNISPSLHSNSQLDINIKGRMMRDILNMAGFQLPSKDMLSGERPAVQSLSTEERSKHAFFLQKPLPESERRRILDSLTPDDAKVLMETEDELSRCGSFERAFPSPTAYKYRKFFETERYYNILLVEWAAKYSKNPGKGISLLQRLAKQTRQVT